MVNDDTATNFARIMLGYPGAMISGNKTAPDHHIAVFNANVCTKTHGKIWYGDLNITEDCEELDKLARLLEEPLYVLREMDARFETEKNPTFERAVATFTPKDSTGSGFFFCKVTFSERLGKIVEKRIVSKLSRKSYFTEEK